MPSSAATGRDSEKFNLRLPDGMRERIAEAAKTSGRSMNSEIVARLEASFAGTMTPGMQAVLDAMLEELERRKRDA